MAIGDNMRQFLKKRGYDQYSAAAKLGISQPRLNQWLTGKRNPNFEQIEAFSRVFDISVDSLMNFNDDLSPTTNILDNIVKIDMLDVVACCGTGVENPQENVNGKWLMPLVDFRQITMSAPENIKMIKVKGDSMEPTLKDGDWVLVDISRITPDSDGLFLLRLASGLAVKRIQCGIGNNINVLSDNGNYPPLPPTTLEDLPIVGKVIYTLIAEKVG